MKENDVEGVTENPIFQAEVLNCTLNKDFLYIKGSITKWINSSHYKLIEIITPPPTEEKEKHESIV